MSDPLGTGDSSPVPDALAAHIACAELSTRLGLGPAIEPPAQPARDRGGEDPRPHRPAADGSAEDHAAVPSHHRVFAALASAGVAGEGTSEVAIHPDVEPEPHEHVVTKTRIGALATTRLDAFLRERRIDTLVLAGLTTSGVVVSTVADAADRDYRLFVLSDACADPDQHLHETLFAKVIPQHAGVVTTAQFAAALDGAS